MNRYIIEGILRDLAAGRDVLVLTATLHGARHALNAMIEHLEGRPTYAWSITNGGEWVRDLDTGAAATFTSARSHRADHVDADVVVVYEYRRMLGDGPAPDAATARRIRDLTADRDAVVID